MNTITILEEDLDGYRGAACLVTDQEGNFFVISTITRGQYAHTYGDFETMAFRSNADGKVTRWDEVCGGGDLTRQDVLDMLTLGEVDNDDWTSVAQAFDREMFSEDEWEDWYRDDVSLLEYDTLGW